MLILIIEKKIMEKELLSRLIKNYNPSKEIIQFEPFNFIWVWKNSFGNDKEYEKYKDLKTQLGQKIGENYSGYQNHDKFRDVLSRITPWIESDFFNMLKSQIVSSSWEIDNSSSVISIKPFPESFSEYEVEYLINSKKYHCVGMDNGKLLIVYDGFLKSVPYRGNLIQIVSQ